MQVYGEDGRSLDEAWVNGPRAYRSVAVPGFPNMFTMMGPHSPVGNQSRSRSPRTRQTTRCGGSSGFATAASRPQPLLKRATKTYNDELKAAMPQTMWSHRMQWLVPRQGTVCLNCSRGTLIGTPNCCAGRC